MSRVPLGAASWWVVAAIACARTVTPEAATVVAPGALDAGDSAASAASAAGAGEEPKRRYIDAHCERHSHTSPSYHDVDKRTGERMEIFGVEVSTLTCPEDAPYSELRGTHELPKDR